MSANNYFGYNLKKYREFYEITQAEMAQKVGLSQSDISKYEIGFSTPFSIRLYNISTIMGASVNDLMSHPIDWALQAELHNAHTEEQSNSIAAYDDDEDDMER